MREEVHSVIDEHLENEFKKSEPTGLLKAFINMFYKGKIFEDGKKYVFDTELCREDLNKNGLRTSFLLSGLWMNKINGRLVDVKSPELGVVDVYKVRPEWCREVE